MKRLFAWLLILLMLVACQPTPEEEFVVNKGDGVLTEKIADVPAEEKRFEAPARVDEIIHGQGLTVELAAEVVLPAVDCYPVAEVVSQTYDAAWARDMLTRIADGRRLLVRESEACANMTREGILREIRGVQESLSTLDEDYANLSEAEREELRKDLNEQLEVWQAYYREAPDSTDGLDADLSDAAYDALGRMNAEVDDERPERKYHSPIEARMDGTIEYANMDDAISQTTGYEPVTGPLRGVTLSEDEAVAVAKTFLARLGETDLEPVLVFAADCPRYGEEYERHDEQAYVIWFTRPVNGMPGAMTHSQQDVFGYYSQNGGDRTYSEPCEQEYAYFKIRDTGVNWFEWHKPSTVTRIVNENVKLVPFETVLATFRKQIMLEVFPVLEEARVSCDYCDMKITDATIRIDRIALENVRIRKEGATGTYLLVPAWSFYGSLVLRGENLLRNIGEGWNIDENGDAVYFVPGACYLQINAIDGSVINPALGY